MDIEYLGHSCFCIQTNNGVRILTDPYTKVGYELPKNVQADIITVSHGHFDHNFVDGVKGAKTVLNTTNPFSGEDLIITGTQTDHDEKGGTLRGKNIVYKIEADGITLTHLGDLGEPCTAQTLAKIGNTDVLFIPVGGTYTIDAEEAKKYISNVKPKIAILMHYRPKDGRIDIASAEEVLSVFAGKAVCVEPKNRITDLEKRLKDGKTEILFMERMA